jgi:uncharacterized protein (DUF983 family)
VSLTRWQPDRTPITPPWPQPPLAVAIGRGVINRCPACGKTSLFIGFLRVTPVCAFCDAPLGLARADDAPPYFTIAIVGHIVIPLMVWTERMPDIPAWVLAAVFVPLAGCLALALLRPVKGGVVGLMLKLGMLKNEDDGNDH